MSQEVVDPEQQAPDGFGHHLTVRDALFEGEARSEIVGIPGAALPAGTDRGIQPAN